MLEIFVRKNCAKKQKIILFYRLNSLGQRTDGSSTRPLAMSTLKAKIMVRLLDLRATKVFHLELWYYHQSPGNIIIYNAGPADEGLYQCVASNSEGVVFSRVSKVTSLWVISKKRINLLWGEQIDNHKKLSSFINPAPLSLNRCDKGGLWAVGGIKGAGWSNTLMSKCLKIGK